MSDFITPDWSAPARVRALVTTRAGGVSVGPYASLNLGTHVGDDAKAVAANRARLSAHLPSSPCWLEQVHGVAVVDASVVTGVPVADAAFARQPGVVCAVMTADCLPVLLCDEAGSVVAVAHAGWRGLHAGVVEATIAAMEVAPSRLMAWLGPAIGPTAFEVGDEVRAAFVGAASEDVAAFQAHAGGKWLADLYALARARLARAGVLNVTGGEYCTYREPEQFFSYRRDHVTGRMASLIWLEPLSAAGQGDLP